MEEVKRVPTTRKAKRGTTVLLVLAGILGLGLIGAAIYFYAIGTPTEDETATERTCACYYIDPAVISECGDPRRGFLFETATSSGDQACSPGCATSKLSPNLLNSTTQQDLYQICQLQTITDTRCTEMTIKDSSGKIVTGKIDAGEEITIEAKFDGEYLDHKFIINNQESEPDIISPDKLTINKTYSNSSSSTINIVATATDTNGNEINSPLCRRLIEMDTEGETNVNEMQIQKRTSEDTHKISKIRIGIGNLTSASEIAIKFSFDRGLSELTMNEGFTVDSTKGEIVIIEQDLYDTNNFTGEKSFSQLDGVIGEIEITADIREDGSSVGTATETVDFPVVEEDTTDTDTTEESSFLVAKTSDVQCVERIEPDNIATFTLTATNQGTADQDITSVKDKLPLGFTYVEGSSSINDADVTDADYVTVTDVGETQEIVWEGEAAWDIASQGTLEIVFQAKADENALTGDNQNEVIITPVEIPADPTTLRAEYVIRVAQDCDDPDETPIDDVETPTTPSTGIFDSIVSRIVLGITTLLIGWYIYNRPMGQAMIEKLVASGLYKEAEMTSWRIFSPKKYFEAKVVKRFKKK